MKQLIFLVLLISAVAFPQNFIPQGDGYTYSFDIKYGGVATKDSVQWIDFDMQYGDVIELWIEGNANNPVDSFYIRSGGKDILVQGMTPSDTIWGNYTNLRDSVFGSISSPVVNSSRGKHIFIYQPLVDILEFGILNYRGILATRTIEMVIKVKKTTSRQ